MGVKSKHVAIVWVQITHMLLLLLGNVGTLIGVIPPPVFQHETDKVDDVGEEGETDEANADGITGCESAAFRQEGERSDETAEVTKPDLPASSNGTAQVSSHYGYSSSTLDDRNDGGCRLTVAVEPADDDGHGGVDAGSSQKEGTVFDAVVVLDAEERRESSEGDEQREKDEEESVFQEIGERGDDHSEDEGANIGWDG